MLLEDIKILNYKAGIQMTSKIPREFIKLSESQSMEKD